MAKAYRSFDLPDNTEMSAVQELDLGVYRHVERRGRISGGWDSATYDRGDGVANPERGAFPVSYSVTKDPLAIADGTYDVLALPEQKQRGKKKSERPLRLVIGHSTNPTRVYHLDKGIQELLNLKANSIVTADRIRAALIKLNDSTK
jgi:hypothetical protein